MAPAMSWLRALSHPRRHTVPRVEHIEEHNQPGDPSGFQPPHDAPHREPQEHQPNQAVQVHRPRRTGKHVVVKDVGQRREWAREREL